MIDLSFVYAMDDLLKKELSGNDRDIVCSLQEYYKKKGNLTDKQKNFLAKIVEKYSASTQEWIDGFDDEKRMRFKQAISYYFKTPYFSEIINQYMMNEKFIPSRRQYEKMCENKYVLRALENYKRPPKYSVGDLVCWRKSIHRGTKTNTVAIIESVSEVPSYHAGSRRYTLMWLDGGERIEVAERNIKLFRLPKKNPNGENL